MDKINMAMPLSEIPFIWEREKTIKIFNDKEIYTISDLMECSKRDLLEMGISALTIAYLNEFLITHCLYLREEDKMPKDIRTANLTSELWERRRYEVAKEIFMKKLDTCYYSTKEKSRAKEIEMSIEIATQFIEKLKAVSECDMENGTWN